MANCHTCGAAVNPDDQVCENCGATLRADTGRQVEKRGNQRTHQRQGHPQGRQPSAGQPQQGQHQGPQHQGHPRQEQPTAQPQQGQPRRGQYGRQPQGQSGQYPPPQDDSGISRRALILGGGGVLVALTGGLIFTNVLGGDGGGGLSYGSTVQGQISQDGPRDPKYNDLAATHTFQGSSGDTVTVSMASQEIDSYLIVTGPTDQVIAENDDGGTNYNSQLTVTLPRDGQYTIWASSYDGDETGSFTLTLETESDMGDI